MIYIFHRFQENSESEQESRNSEVVTSDNDNADVSIDVDMVDKDIEEREANEAQVRLIWPRQCSLEMLRLFD